MAKRFSRRHEAAERVEMRRWLRRNGIDPVMGQEPNHTQGLMLQVIALRAAIAKARG